MPSYENRNLIDVRIGKTHYIQILFHLRKKDIQWFNDNSETNIKQLLQLLSRDILPVECKDEIGGGACTGRKSDDLGQHKGGKKNVKKTRKGVKRKHNAITTNNTNKNDGSSSKKGGFKHAQNKNNKKQGKKTNTTNTNKKDADDSPNTISSHLSSKIFNSENTFLFATNIQILYKCETVQTSHSTILNYNATDTTSDNDISTTFEEDERKKKKEILDDQDSGENTSISLSTSNRTKSKSRSKSKSTSSNNNRKNNNSKSLKLSTFQHLKPLSKRIIIWCYPFDPNKPQELNMLNSIQTFPRPELIPISSLYCEDVS